MPVAIGGLEDPLFGPAVSFFDRPAALTDLVGDRAYRIPPISALDAAETVRAIKAAPLLFGYRGSEQVDVPAVEDLLRRVAQLKIDLPQVSSIDLMLVHATAAGVRVLHARAHASPGGRRPVGPVRAPAQQLSRRLASRLSVRDRLTGMRSNPASATGDRYDRSRDLDVAIEKTGYYPTVVAAGVDAALAGEQVVSFLVHHEPTIDRDEVRRHITVVVLTPTRLILGHTDEHAPDDLLPEPYTSTSTEAIGLTSVRSVVVNRMVANPARLRGRVPPPAEAVLTVGWGGVAGSTSSRPCATTPSATPTTATPACSGPTTSRCG